MLQFVVQEESAQKKTPPDGAFVRGLFLEGARWNPQLRCLDELQKTWYDPMPSVCELAVCVSDSQL